MFRNKLSTILLITTIVVGGIFRFIYLDKFPVSLNWDEASHGYNAYSVLQTGKDEWGVRLPLIFRAFGDYKLPAYIYLSIVPIAIFGLNAFAIRFVSALAGTIAILGMYFLANTIFNNKKISIFGFEFSLGLMAAILLAISPWHFFLSRPALEANLSLTLIIFGSYFALKALNNAKFFILSSLAFSISLHSYNTARIFVPLFVISFYFIFKSSIKVNRYLITSLIILFLSIVPIVLQIYTGEATARYDKLAILNENAVYTIGQNRINSTYPSWISHLVYNRPVYFLETVVKNYLGFFSLGFYQQTASPHAQFAIPGQLLFSPIILFLSLIGLFICLKKINDKSHQLLITILLIAPFAASLTDTPLQALRPSPLIPVIILLSIKGISEMINYVPKKNYSILLLLIFIFSGISFFQYLKDYFISYKDTYANSWQYGYEEAMKYVKNHQSEYDRVFITKKYGEPHIFYAFFNKINPDKLFPGENNIRFKQSDWYWTDKIDSVYFINDWLIPNEVKVSTLNLESGQDVSTKNSMLITVPDHIPQDSVVLKTINFPDGKIAFNIVKLL